MNEKVNDNRRTSEGYLSFLVKESICNHWARMEDVCRVVVAMHDPMGLGFSLVKPNECEVLSEEAQRGGVVCSC